MKRWIVIFLGALAWIAFSMCAGAGSVHLGMLGLPTVRYIGVGGLAHRGMYSVVEGGGAIEVYPGKDLDSGVHDHATAHTSNEHEAYCLRTRSWDEGGIRAYEVRFFPSYGKPKGIFWAWRWKRDLVYRVTTFIPPHFEHTEDFRESDLHMLDEIFATVEREDPRFWGQQIRVSNPVVQTGINPIALVFEVLTFIAAGAVIVSGCVLVVRVVRRWKGD
mgnify:CR=1 FL=1